jgi:hypothetical protein
VRAGEGQQRRRDVLVGELVVGAAGRLGQPPLDASANSFLSSAV